MQKIPSLAPYRQRFEELENILGSSDVYSDPKKAAEYSREHQKIKEALDLEDRLKEIEQQISDNSEMLAEGELDEEMIQLAKEEIESLEQEKDEKEKKLLVAMVPPDPSDDRNTVMEIRGGAGGDEASIFAGDLYRMYCRYAEKHGWQIENLGSSPSESGGLKEISFLIKGDQVFKRFEI